MAIASVVDAMLAIWNSGDASRASEIYAPVSQVRFVIDSGAGADSYDSPAAISTGIAEQGTHALVMTRTGGVTCQSAFCAFPMTWATTDRQGNAVVVLSLGASDHIVSQYVIGTSGSAPVAQAAPAPDVLVTAIDDLIAGFDAHDLERASASFTDEAEWRYTYVQSGYTFGWAGEYVGIDQIGAFFGEAWQSVSKERSGEVIAQGPLLICPIKLTVAGTGGVEYWVVQVGADNRIAYVWAVGG